MYAYPAGAAAAGVAAGASTPAYATGQYPAAGHHAAEAAAAAAAAAGGGGSGSGSGSGSGVEMMVQTPYGMAPYSYMPFPGVPYAPTQQGYSVRRASLCWAPRDYCSSITTAV